MRRRMRASARDRLVEEQWTVEETRRGCRVRRYRETRCDTATSRAPMSAVLRGSTSTPQTGRRRLRRYTPAAARTRGCESTLPCGERSAPTFLTVSPPTRLSLRAGRRWLAVLTDETRAAACQLEVRRYMRVTWRSAEADASYPTEGRPQLATASRSLCSPATAAGNASMQRG
jgi:hypothetical protein